MFISKNKNELLFLSGYVTTIFLFSYFLSFILPCCFRTVKGAFDWLYTGIEINGIKTLFNLIGHNSCQVRRKT